MSESVIEFAKGVIRTEAAAVLSLLPHFGDPFDRAAKMIADCSASVLVSGVGKAGHIARKVSATLASTGTPSHFLSATDAVHGDLGSVRTGDVVVIFSYSGESDEILRLLSLLKKLSHPTIAITKGKGTSLGKHADVVLPTGDIEEACPLRLAPSASTTAMLALGDALALSAMKLRNFTADDFAVYHPAGQIGRQLIKVGEAMTFRRGENLPLASDTLTVGGVLASVASIKRRSGAVILTDDATGKLSGIFSDGDLRRLVTSDPRALERNVRDVMTRDPKRIHESALASEAMATLHQFRFDELPVVNDAGEPVGLIDVQDLVVLRMLDVSEK